MTSSLGRPFLPLIVFLLQGSFLITAHAETEKPLPNDYESYVLEAVFPDSSPAFDPFTHGRPGSPFGPGKIFASGGISQCGPMELPMSSEFADPGETQACILILGNGVECVPEIDHEKPGVAITFPNTGVLFADAPWSIVSQTSSFVTITNGHRVIRFEFRITTEVTVITKVEYLR